MARKGKRGCSCHDEKMIGHSFLPGAAIFSCQMLSDPSVKVANSRFDPKVAGRLIRLLAGDSRLGIMGHVGAGTWQTHAKLSLCLYYQQRYWELRMDFFA